LEQDGSKAARKVNLTSARTPPDVVVRVSRQKHQ
jgi:hypothetical protein